MSLTHPHRVHIRKGFRQFPPPRTARVPITVACEWGPASTSPERRPYTHAS